MNRGGEPTATEAVTAYQERARKAGALRSMSAAVPAFIKRTNSAHEFNVAAVSPRDFSNVTFRRPWFRPPHAPRARARHNANRYRPFNAMILNGERGRQFMVNENPHSVRLSIGIKSRKRQRLAVVVGVYYDCFRQHLAQRVVKKNRHNT